MHQEEAKKKLAIILTALFLTVGSASADELLKANVDMALFFSVYSSADKNSAQIESGGDIGGATLGLCWEHVFYTPGKWTFYAGVQGAYVLIGASAYGVFSAGYTIPNPFGWDSYHLELLSTVGLGYMAAGFSGFQGYGSAFANTQICIMPNSSGFHLGLGLSYVVSAFNFDGYFTSGAGLSLSIGGKFGRRR